MFVLPDGRRATGRILVGKPRAGPRNAECVVALEGLRGALGGRPTIHGEDTLQALTLGIQFLATLLRQFIAAGGRVLDREGNDAALEATFGALRRRQTRRR